MGHSTYKMGIGHWRFWEEESTFRHQTLDFWDLGVERKKIKIQKKQAKNGLQSRSGCHGLSWTGIDCHGLS